MQWNAFGFATSFILAFLAVLFLSSERVITAFIVLGQGHFFLTYMYQWRAGKIGMTYGALYLCALVALLTSAAYLPDPVLWSFVGAGAIFSAHFFFDEMFINSRELSKRRVLLGCAFVLMYSALLIRSAYGWSAPLAAGSAALLLAAPLAIAMLREKDINVPDMFFLVFVAVLVLILFMPWAITLPAALGFIILFHYARWYLYFYFRFRDTDGEKFRRYITDVASVNAIVVGAFAVYAMTPAAAALGYLFDPVYFYIWTILHVAFSVRIPRGFFGRVFGRIA